MLGMKWPASAAIWRFFLKKSRTCSRSFRVVASNFFSKSFRATSSFLHLSKSILKVSKCFIYIEVYVVSTRLSFQFRRVSPPCCFLHLRLRWLRLIGARGRLSRCGLGSRSRFDVIVEERVQCGLLDNI